MKEKIIKIIKREFNARALKIKRITSGYSHYMYDVKINKEPKELIVRFSNNSKEDVNLGKEKYVIELLQKNKIPAPIIYVYKKDYMILQKFKGEKLDLLWDSLSKKEKIQITEKIGKLMKKMHKIKLKKFGVIEENGKINSDNPFKFRKMGSQTNYNLFLREWLRQIFEDFARLLSYPHVPKEFMSDIFLYLTKNLKHLKYQGKPTFTHGDFLPGHIFVKKINNNYKIEGIIDFEFAISSCPEYDFIKMHRKGFFDDKNLKKALKKGYGKIDEKAVEVFRVMRDLGFAWAVLESGNKKLSNKTIRILNNKLKKQ